MATIQSVPKTKFTQSEWLNFCIFIVNYLNASNFSVLKFDKESKLFNAKVDQFDGSLNKISKADYSLRSKELKKKINASRIGFYNLVKGELSSEDAETAAAAAIIFEVLKKYTNMGRMKYNDILKFLNNLIKECESDKYKTYIEKLNLTKRVTGLKTLYNEAMELESSLFDDEGLNKRKRKATITRLELNNAYEKLVKRLNALALIDGDTDYLELFGWWNALIDKYRTVISSRIGTGKGGKTDDGEEAQHDPDSGNEEGGGSGGGDRPEIE